MFASKSGDKFAGCGRATGRGTRRSRRPTWRSQRTSRSGRTETPAHRPDVPLERSSCATKWERDDYRERTIETAIAASTEALVPDRVPSGDAVGTRTASALGEGRKLRSRPRVPT